MEHKEQTNTYWERLENEAEQYFLRGRLIKDMEEYMQQKPCRILEIGCGEGLLLNAMHKVNPNAECYGIELSENAVKAGKEKYPQIHFINQDLHAYFDSPEFERFDIVLSCNVMHELYTQVRRENGVEKAENYVISLFAKLRECLTPGGLFVLVDGVLPDDERDGTVSFILTKHGKRIYDIIRDSYTFLRQPLPEAAAGQVVTAPSIDFEKFITKSLFVETPDWEIERQESYQYFSRLRLEEIFRKLGFMIMREELQVEQWELWQKLVKVVDGRFPFENITLFCIAAGESEKGL